MNKEPTKILLIEDNPGDARIVKEELSEEIDFMFELLTVDRLSLGIDLIKEENIDLVLLDLSLPDSNGLNTFIEINKAAANTPIIILSGNRDEDIAKNAVAKGAQDYLVKGEIGSTILVKTIMNAIDKQSDKKKLKELTNLNDIKYTEELVALTDTSGNIVFANDAFKGIVGFENVIGRNMNILKSGRHEDNFYKQMWETVLRGEIFKGIFINKNSSGELFFEQKTITPIKNSSGEITHFISCGKDISSLISNDPNITSKQN